MTVFYLNLKRRKDREEQFLRTNTGIARFHRWNAVDGSELCNEDLLRTGVIAEPLKAYTPGALGCASSHKCIWDRCAGGDAALTVCEDDAIFNRHFRRQATTVLAGLPWDWDIIFWGWNRDSILHVDMIEGTAETVMHFNSAMLADRTSEFQQKSYDVLPLKLIAVFGTICYSLSPKGARLLLERCFPLKNEVVSLRGLRRRFTNFGIDSIMNKHYPALNSYVSFPPLVWTENDKSTSDVVPSLPKLPEPLGDQTTSQ